MPSSSAGNTFCGREQDNAEHATDSLVCVITRFKDAAWGYFELSSAAQQLLTASELSAEERSLLTEQRTSYAHYADIFYAYNHIYASTTDPFTSLQPDVLLQVATFLLNNLSPGMTPRGISRANVLYTLARQAMTLHAYKLAR
jgi:hypothetical protein